MKTTKDWNIYCEKTFNNLKANAHKWGTSQEWDRAISRDFYLGVFDSGNPNPSGYISEEAFVNKMSNKKTVYDHCYSPQFIGRMIMDNQEIYLTDYEKFKEVFWYACRTIIVTQKENESLSYLTTNDKDGFKVHVPTNMKYNHLGINLYEREQGKVHWKYVLPLPTNVLDVPEELLEYEKRYLVG
jgi:hypothetical protein